jgi:hypothetical protein
VGTGLEGDIGRRITCPLTRRCQRLYLRMRTARLVMPAFTDNFVA